jgi:PIN domain nuclease of toxin-antitoxin system
MAVVSLCFAPTLRAGGKNTRRKVGRPQRGPWQGLREVVGHLAKAGADRAQIDAMLADLPLMYAAPDEMLAIEAGMMRPVGESFGLSLADRLCLALARRLDVAAMTADRVWLQAAGPLAVKVELVR